MLDLRWWIANKTSWAKLAIIISYPTSANGPIVLLKMPQNIEIFPTLFCKIKHNIIMYKNTMVEYGIMAHNSYMMAKPMKTHELHNSMIHW